jgi:hypothetical protein
LSLCVTSHDSPFIAEGRHAQRYWAPICEPRDIKNIELGATNVAAGAILLCPYARDLHILGVQGKLLVEGMMSDVRCSAWVHCSPTDWSGAPSAG